MQKAIIFHGQLLYADEGVQMWERLKIDCGIEIFSQKNKA
jgi:hypothetical protein